MAYCVMLLSVNRQYVTCMVNSDGYFAVDRRWLSYMEGATAFPPALWGGGFLRCELFIDES
jgi:hypothetical protein